MPSLGSRGLKKTWLLFDRNGTTFDCGLCLLLWLSFTEVNGTDLQYHTQPVERCGALCGINPPWFSNPEEPLCVGCQVLKKKHVVFGTPIEMNEESCACADISPFSGAG